MNNPPAPAVVAAFRQQIVARHNSARTATSRRYAGTAARINHVRQSDWALKILFTEMIQSSLTKADIEDMYNHALAPHYAISGLRTHYQLNDRWRNRQRPGRQHANWTVVNARPSRLSAAAQAEKQGVLVALCAAAAAMGIPIHPSNLPVPIPTNVPSGVANASGVTAASANANASTSTNTMNTNTNNISTNTSANTNTGTNTGTNTAASMGTTSTSGSAVANSNQTASTAAQDAADTDLEIIESMPGHLDLDQETNSAMPGVSYGDYASFLADHPVQPDQPDPLADIQ